jgi:hypothetical protein
MKYKCKYAKQERTDVQQIEALERTHFLHAFFACIIDFCVNLCPIPVGCCKDCRMKILRYTML